jgi:hypothetical protein
MSRFQGQRHRMKRDEIWVPVNRDFYSHYTHHHLENIRGPYGLKTRHTAPVQRFETAIKSDPEMYDLFSQIFLQVSKENTVCL